jgi:hypothetical protein
MTFSERKSNAFSIERLQNKLLKNAFEKKEKFYISSKLQEKIGNKMRLDVPLTMAGSNGP